MRYSPRIQRALFAIDRLLGPLGLVLVTSMDGEPGEGLRITRIRLARRSSFLPE
ncbi:MULTISPECIES: hypothetical protein [Methylorubrum]|uniref:hypothetical protein n=1 Tax=Methylorubrum TaxID=2282523 RepID=UPI00209ED5E4|nr:MULTISPECIES: hypothetical protein [Methylorubrum]MCP1550701.1 hypothetical protein [Methylorubrum zatmanii]MCP1552686.1 hypothetical protein [Methylorubrum extorquens]MCP1581004.1 hypothetical protein [Methylorubrum extorquens]